MTIVVALMLSGTLARAQDNSAPPDTIEARVRGCAPWHADHGHGTGAPWLKGQSPAYLKAQLEAFASGARRNDNCEQMRNIARSMTKDEIEAAAEYLFAPAAGRWDCGRPKVIHDNLPFEATPASRKAASFSLIGQNNRTNLQQLQGLADSYGMRERVV